MSIAKGLSIYGNGVNLACAFKEFSPTGEQESLDATTLCSTDKVYELGFKTGTVSTNGVWKYDQTNADEIHNVLTAAFSGGSAVILTGSYETLTVGNPAVLVNGQVTKWSLPSQVGQLIMVSADFQATGGIGYGKWLFSASVNNTTTDGTGIDNAAATANGGSFHVHVQNPSQLAGSVKIQHSTDNSTFTDLGTATLTTAKLEALTVEVAAGTTVNRYIRARATATSGTITFQAAFARR